MVKVRNTTGADAQSPMERLVMELVPIVHGRLDQLACDWIQEQVAGATVLHADAAINALINALLVEAAKGGATMVAGNQMTDEQAARVIEGLAKALCSNFFAQLQDKRISYREFNRPN